MLTPDYIVGLVDGEGSFTVYIRDPEEKRLRIRRVKASPRFYVNLGEKDKKALQELKRYFGCGEIYFRKENRLNHQNCYRYEVFNRTDLQKVIIPFFKEHQPRFPSRQKDFKLFCKLMEGIIRKEHLNPSGLKRLYQIKQLMH